MSYKMKKCVICKKAKIIKEFEYFTPPIGETNYGIKNQNYYRYYLKCSNCSHWFSKSKIKFKNFYNSKYADATYKGLIKKNFDKIKKLANKKSDNFFRVKRINQFIQKFSFNNKKINLLDVGSGLGIFPFRMKQKKYQCVALDPDKRNCQHIKKNLKIDVICGDFLKIKFSKKFDLITFNKVLEHVKNPEIMLSKAKKLLSKNGIIYCEVPDEKAKIEGKNREEFHIDHIHVFSKKSLKELAKKTNLKIYKIESIREPSTKYTIYSFLH